MPAGLLQIEAALDPALPAPEQEDAEGEGQRRSAPLVHNFMMARFRLGEEGCFKI